MFHFSRSLSEFGSYHIACRSHLRSIVARAHHHSYHQHNSSHIWIRSWAPVHSDTRVRSPWSRSLMRRGALGSHSSALRSRGRDDCRCNDGLVHSYSTGDHLPTPDVLAPSSISPPVLYQQKDLKTYISDLLPAKWC